MQQRLLKRLSACLGFICLASLLLWVQSFLWPIQGWLGTKAGGTLIGVASNRGNVVISVLTKWPEDVVSRLAPSRVACYPVLECVKSRQSSSMGAQICLNDVTPNLDDDYQIRWHTPSHPRDFGGIMFTPATVPLTKATSRYFKIAVPFNWLVLLSGALPLWNLLGWFFP